MRAEALRAVIYARVSSSIQKEKKTIDAQLAELPAIVRQQGWTLIDTITDDGVSGKTFDRPGFKRVERMITERAFDVLVVIDTDRIGRPEDRLDSAGLQQFLKDNGIKIFSPASGMIDLDNEDQALLADIRLTMAGWQRRGLLARTARGQREGARKGRRYRGPDPYGLQWVDDPKLESRGSYRLHPDEAPIIKRMIKLAIGGMGRAFIAHTLNREGFRTRPGKLVPNGGKWTGGFITKLLRSRLLVGEFEVFRKSTPMIIRTEPFIDPETFQRLQLALDSRIVRKTRAATGKPIPYLLSGLLKCSLCGLAMWVQKPDPTKRRHYYRCSSSNTWRARGYDGPCGQRHHETSPLDIKVWMTLVKVLSDPSLLAEAASLSMAEAAKGKDWTSIAAAARTRLGELEELEAEVLTRRRKGRLSAAACDRELDALAVERTATEARLRTAEVEAARDDGGRRRLQELRARAGELTASIRGADFETRKKIVTLFVSPDNGGSMTIDRAGNVEVRGVLPLSSSSVAEVRVLVPAA